MTITVDNFNYGTSTTATAVTVTVSITLSKGSGNNRKVVVLTHNEAVTNIAVTDVQVNSSSISGGATYTQTQSFNQCEYWYMDDADLPASSGTYNVDVDFPASTGSGSRYAWVYAFYDCEQGAATSGGTSSASSNDLTHSFAVGSNEHVLTCAGHGDAGDWTQPSGYTERADDQLGATASGGVADLFETTGGTKSLRWQNTASAQRLVILSVALADDPATPAALPAGTLALLGVGK